MPRRRTAYRLDLDTLRRLWFHRQGLATPRGGKLTSKAFIEHLERTGGLQQDSVNVLERAHYLTLWSRFGEYDRALPDRWTYRDRIAYEYWGHEACVLPASRLPLSLRGMRRFAPSGKWWNERKPSVASIRRVLRRLREEGALESADFERTGDPTGPWWDWKEDKRSLENLWFRGKVAVAERRHFRRVYDLAERVYDHARPASAIEYEDTWLATGLSGCGVASEKHLAGYWTAPRLSAAERRKVVARALRAKRVVEVEVDGLAGSWLARPEELEGAERLPAPTGTTLLSPFDSFLWQRDRAEELLGFRYRIEIYVPPERRVFGYYVLPILHEGRLVGRLDPKLHRDRGELEIKAIYLEEGFTRGAEFDRALAETLADLAKFLGAETVSLPRGWRDLAC